MTMIFDVTVPHPPKEIVLKFGELAYVTHDERQKILALPYGQFHPACEYLRKRIKLLKKKAGGK